jgi:hypothetical protein
MQYLICQEKEKFPAISPHFYFLFFLLLKKMQYGNNIICKARSNMCKLDDTNTEKQSLNLLSLSSPTSTCNALLREIGGRTKLVPRLHTK